MKISRRKFLATAPVVAGGVLLFQPAAAGQAPAGADSLSRLTWDSFYPFITTDFTFRRGSGAVSLKLVDMLDTAPEDSNWANKRHCFVLKFRGPFGQPLGQGTYRVNHFQIGDFDLFITDGGRSGNKQSYIAVINRITTS